MRASDGQVVHRSGHWVRARVRGAIALAVLAVALGWPSAGCGGGGDATSTATTDVAVTTTSSSSSTDAATVPTSAAGATTAPTADANEVVVLGPPADGLVPARPGAEIAWEAVGFGWLLVDHPGWGVERTDPPRLDRRGLYFVGPDDQVFGVSALPTDGTELIEVSSDGRRVLLQSFEEPPGGVCASEAPVDVDQYGYAIVDLPTTERRAVVPPVRQSCFDPPMIRRASFGVDGRSVWVSETWYGDDRRQVVRHRISRVGVDDGTWTTVLDEHAGTVPADYGFAPPGRLEPTIIELGDGRLATTSLSGVRLRDASGTPLHPLSVPDERCSLVEAWNEGQLVAHCAAPQPPDLGCWTNGLWLVPVDGSPTSLLAIPLDENGQPACFSGYHWADQLGDAIALQATHGEGECTANVEFLGGDGIRQWAPTFVDSCDEKLLGARNDAWLLTAQAYEQPDRFIVAVALDGTERIVPVPSGNVVAIGRLVGGDERIPAG